MPKKDTSFRKTPALSGSKGPNTATPQPFHLLRYFILTSLLIILTTAILMQFIYRRAAVGTIIILGETINITLAQTALSSMRPQLLEYLKRMEDATAEDARNQTVPTELSQAFQRLINETAIVRIKVYNRQAVVIYSTLSSQIGQVQLDNRGVLNALSGHTMSELIYRDSFNRFDKEQSESNLIQTYLPALNEPLGETMGAFEIYFDVNFLVKHTEHFQLLMLFSSCGIFLLMFALLVGSVWRANIVMARQDQVIRERTHMLEFLTAQMLSDQEDEKKNIAHGLHESVAQTLCGIKVRLETMAREVDKSSPLVDSFASLTGYLQEAISETSAIAMRLRPSSLDEFGLIETLMEFSKDLEKSHPQLSIELLTEAAEEDITQSLKIIIFRIVQDTLNNLATQSEADQVKLVLRSDNGSIELEIEENSRPYARKSGSTGERIYKAILPMRERTLLSGGDFSSSQNRLGRKHRSLWEF